VLAGVAFGPSLGVRVALSGDDGGLVAFTLALGAGSSVLVVVLGALAAAVQPIPASTLTFSEEGIRQEIGGVVRAHAWDWVLDFTRADEALAICVKPPPMRTGRLARPEPEWLLMRSEDVGAGTIAELVALLEAKAKVRRR
jgi:hypothetical protein